MVTVLSGGVTSNAVVFIINAAGGSTTYQLSGMMTDGAVLGGTMTVDEVAGKVTSASFTIGAPDSFTTSITRQSFALTFPAGTQYWAVYSAVAPGPYPSLNLLFPTNTLVGYTGGSICSNSRASLCPSGSGFNETSGSTSSSRRRAGAHSERQLYSDHRSSLLSRTITFGGLSNVTWALPRSSSVQRPVRA